MGGRASTDAAEALDPEVAKAISFIRERVNTPIGVGDVVGQVSLSRRCLYDRFRESTGKSILAYIRDHRLDDFTRLMLETNLTVSEIAYAMGYDSDGNVARLFKANFGMPPVAYRRMHAGKYGSLGSG